ncbi:hypothetical protein J6590_085616 [Homalodisca vitripennis]|nr:hypothetical protein J6590_085616 [Homalodisca vitripennis]
MESPPPTPRRGIPLRPSCNNGDKKSTNEPLFHESAVYCTLTNQSQRLTYQGSVLPTLQATARLLSTLSVPPGALSTLATADHTYSTRDFTPHDWPHSFAVFGGHLPSSRLPTRQQPISHFLITTWPSTTADYGYPS